MSRASRWLVFGTVLGAAAYFALSQMGEGDRAAVLCHPGAPTLAYNPNGYFKNGRQVAHDVYAYFYPNILYALRSLGDGGRGLLWNPLQNCGQPFFANSQTGLFYPPNVLFLLVGPDAALRLIPLVNFIVAGLSTFFLCRELGVGTTAALSGALAFELGDITVALTV